MYTGGTLKGDFVVVYGVEGVNECRSNVLKREIKGFIMAQMTQNGKELSTHIFDLFIRVQRVDDCDFSFSAGQNCWNRLLRN